jgi:hypothetical protein
MRAARDCVNEVVKAGLAPMFRAHGFRRSGFNFVRRVGAVANFFNVQLFQWNRGEEGLFFLNAGVMFDEIFALRGEAAPAMPKYFDCQFMVRLEYLNSSLPQSYKVDAQTDATELASSLAELVESTYVLPLNSVAGAKDFAATGWVRAVPWGFPALFAYVVGDVDEARRLVQLEAETFAGRGLTFESVAKSLGLQFD